MVVGEPFETSHKAEFCRSDRQMLDSLMDNYANWNIEEPSHIKSSSSIHDFSKVQASSFTSQSKKQKKSTNKIAIIGAGISGMYLAWMMKKMNPQLDVEIYEANSKRLGGRIYTHYFPKSSKSNENSSSEQPPPSKKRKLDSESEKPIDFQDRDVLSKQEKEEARNDFRYAELGAMRIPDTHDRVFDCLNKLGLRKDTPHDSEEKDVIHYVFSDGNNLNQYNNITLKNKEIGKEGKSMKQYHTLKGEIPEYLRESNPEDILHDVLHYWVKGLEDDRFHDATMKAMVERGFDSKTLREHLHENGFSSETISWLETVDSATGRFDRSLIEAVIDHSYYDNTDLKWWTVNKGMDRIIDRMEEKLSHLNIPIHTGHFVTDIRKENDEYFLEFEHKSPSPTYDRIVVTAPFGVVRMWSMKDLDLSWKKKDVIRSLQYDDSCKVAVKFSEKFWRSRKEQEDIKGGTSHSDLPSRRAVYPCYGLKDKSGEGAMLTSYTWAIDAKRMGALTPRERRDQTLKDLDLIYEKNGFQPSQYATQDHASIYWSEEKTALGTFSFYGPGQFGKVYRNAVLPEDEGHVHFCGEHLSIYHPWIEGALRSAFRVVLEINQEDHLFQENDLKEWDIEGKMKLYRNNLWKY
eukprot:gb/GECH01011720.1/.p1 GENE.gb/GECH01011720.1/~~gb/GECH01011720.1/.p1  ORF type:complete len:632 (+),score=191.66 gb/GECH01011720.1/:1-1896(+)